MFRKIAKGLEQNLSIICKDSNKPLFWKIHQSMNDLSNSNENTHSGVPLQ